MQNFGYNDLRLVKPRTNHLGEAAKLPAVKATPIPHDIYGITADHLRSLEKIAAGPPTGISLNKQLIRVPQRGTIVEIFNVRPDVIRPHSRKLQTSTIKQLYEHPRISGQRAFSAI
jgi:hypothetical protein